MPCAPDDSKGDATDAVKTLYAELCDQPEASGLDLSALTVASEPTRTLIVQASNSSSSSSIWDLSLRHQLSKVELNWSPIHGAEFLSPRSRLRRALAAPERKERERLKKIREQRQLEATNSSNSLVPQQPGPTPDGRFWQLFLAILSLVEGATIALVLSISIQLQEDLQISLRETAALPLYQALFRAGSAPLWSIITDRHLLSRKLVLAWSCIIYGILTCLLAISGTTTSMTLLCSFSGLFLGSTRPVCYGILANSSTDAKRGQVFGWNISAHVLGILLGSQLGRNADRWSLGLQGWRSACLIVGLTTVVVGGLVLLLLTVPEEAQAQLPKQGRFADVQRTFRFLRKPTFVILVLQGFFGCVPWNAMGYRKLFFQVYGFNDDQVSVFGLVGSISEIVGSLFGGLLADFTVRNGYPVHGRPFVAHGSLLLGITTACLTFLVEPPRSFEFLYHLLLSSLFGFTVSWCAAGVNFPILAQIVAPQDRGMVMACQIALEGTWAALLGNAMVVFFIHAAFSLSLPDEREHCRGSQTGDEDLLAKALTLTTALPWLVCIGFYSMLHCTYPRDVWRKQVSEIEAASGRESKKKLQEPASEERHTMKKFKHADTHQEAEATGLAPVLLGRSSTNYRGSSSSGVLA